MHVPRQHAGANACPGEPSGSPSCPLADLYGVGLSSALKSLQPTEPPAFSLVATGFFASLPMNDRTDCRSPAFGSTGEKQQAVPRRGIPRRKERGCVAPSQRHGIPRFARDDISFQQLRVHQPSHSPRLGAAMLRATTDIQSFIRSELETVTLSIVKGPVECSQRLNLARSTTACSQESGQPSGTACQRPQLTRPAPTDDPSFPAERLDARGERCRRLPGAAHLGDGRAATRDRHAAPGPHAAEDLGELRPGLAR